MLKTMWMNGSAQVCGTFTDEEDLHNITHVDAHVGTFIDLPYLESEASTTFILGSCVHREGEPWSPGTHKREVNVASCTDGAMYHEDPITALDLSLV